MTRKEKEFRLKDLQKIIPQLEKEMKKAHQEASAKSSNVDKLKNEQISICASLTAVSKEIGVSDHALMRYLERKYKFDFEQYREEILTPVVKQAIKAGATSINVGGVSFKVTSNTITTTI